MDRIRTILYIAVIGLIASCNNCEPIVPTGNSVRVELVSLFGENPNLPVFFRSISGMGIDSALYDSVTIQRFNLSLNRQLDSSAFVLQYDPELGRENDTLDLAYRRLISVNGPDCEAFITFSQIRRGGRTTLDSILILKDFIDEDTTETALRIFFDPNDFIDVN